MTRRIGDVLVLEPEPAAKCELCGALEELRPYGPKGENVCFPCGQKDPAAMLRAFAARLEGVSTVDNRDVLGPLRC